MLYYSLEKSFPHIKECYAYKYRTTILKTIIKIFDIIKSKFHCAATLSTILNKKVSGEKCLLKKKNVSYFYFYCLSFKKYDLYNFNQILTFCLYKLISFFIQTCAKTKIPDVSSLKYTINELLRYQNLSQYIKQHALNRFELVEWNMIEDMDRRKHKAVEEIRDAIPDYTERLILMAEVFDRYRGGIYHMEQVKQWLLKGFSLQLQNILQHAKSVRAGVTKEAHLNQVLNAIQEFERNYRTQYKQIQKQIYRLVD